MSVPGFTDLNSPLTQPPAAPVDERLQSLDAYRGLIMISLAFAGFGLAQTAANHLEASPDDQLWKVVQFQFSHAQWLGCSFWDLIQPSFMFMVGVSMAFSYAKRQERGDSYFNMFSHAVWRSVLLILLGIFLVSNWGKSTNWSLMNVLTQIGLGYTFLFLLWGRSLRTMAEAAVLILVGTWCMYNFYQHAGFDETKETGVTAEWAHRYLEVGDEGMTWTQFFSAVGLTERSEDEDRPSVVENRNVGKPWHKNANVGQAIDMKILNALPRTEPYKFSSGGYQTINFLPSLATMILGLMCGELLRSNRSAGRKFLLLILWGVVGIAVGKGIDLAGFCPVVKRIWTPSWALFSTGWCCLILASLYLLIDVMRVRFWAFPLRVVGVNSIAAYCMAQLLKPWVRRSLETHFGDQVFQLRAKVGHDYYKLRFIEESQEPIIALYEPTIQAVMVGMVFWLVCLWLYRNKVFIRI